MIGGIDSTTLDGMQEMLRSLMKESGKELLEQADPAATAAASAVQSTAALASPVKASAPANMMARNFAGASSGTSVYVQAKLNSFQVSAQYEAAQKSTAVAILDSFGGIKGASVYDPHGNKKSSGGGASEATIRRALKQRSEKEIMENAQAEFERRREEEKAAEAAAVSEGASTPSTAGLPARDTGTDVPMPDIATPAPAADIASPAPAPEAAPAQVSATAAYSAKASPKPSLNIVV